jgi:cell division septation protein DedD
MGRTYQFVAAISPDTWNSSHSIASQDLCSFRDFSFTHYYRRAGAVMGIEQLDKLLVEGGPVEPALLPETFVYEQPKRRQMTPQSSVKNWLRIRAMLNIRTRRRARRLLWRASWLLLVGGVAYLVFFALVNDGLPVDQAHTIPAAQPANPSRPTHGAVAEERSFYGLASTPPDVAVEPLKNSSLVSPQQNAAVPENDGGYVVQVSAERTDAKAQVSFKTLQSRFPHVLGDRSPLIRRVELGEKGIFYRAQIGPFDTAEKAKQLCARLKSAGGHCMVQKNS